MVSIYQYLDFNAKFDKRTPGLFKLEYEGDEMIGLCSKSYVVANSKETKPENSKD
jgi:hypothetical protein